MLIGLNSNDFFCFVIKFSGIVKISTGTLNIYIYAYIQPPFPHPPKKNTLEAVGRSSETRLQVSENNYF